MTPKNPRSSKLAPTLIVPLVPALLAGALVAAGSRPGEAQAPGAAADAVTAGAARLAAEVLASVPGSADPCTASAGVLAYGSVKGLQSDLAAAVAVCLNQSEPGELASCLADAWVELRAGLDLVKAQHGARLRACALVGGGAYDPAIVPSSFVARVDHPYFPLSAGSTWLYHKTTDEGLETIEVEVSGATTEILGVACTVVDVVERLEGVLIEHTFDYFAQDIGGNVWYFGELSLSYKDGELASLDGSWKAGEAGASPGIVMHSAPTPGTSYRREFAPGVAEDLATVESLGETVTVPCGTFRDTVGTIDWSPFEPWEIEIKHYAPGVGLVLEVDEETGELTELMEVTLGS